MSSVSRAYINNFTSMLDTVDKRTENAIRQEIEARNLEQRILDGEADAYDELMRIMRVAVPASSQMSSALSARFYNGIREGANERTRYVAESFDTVDDEELYGLVYGQAKEYARGNSTVPLYKSMGGVNSTFTRYAANETVRRNAEKDPAKPKFAIVPGAGACVFCKERAMSGVILPRAADVHSHAHCTCVASPVFKNSTIQGYDPQKDLDAYYKAKEAYTSGEISDDLKQRIDAARERHNAAYKEYKRAKARGETPTTNVRNPWKENNAYLMVWREMEKQQ